ncbi:hypothetical protein QL285_054154 [Trifolium repens]|nr:hypothetical protein QL285_054154 [Trifolium repens]
MSSWHDENISFKNKASDVLASKQLPSWHDGSHRTTMNAQFIHFFGFFLSFLYFCSFFVPFFDSSSFPSYLGLSWSFYFTTSNNTKHTTEIPVIRIYIKKRNISLLFMHWPVPFLHLMVHGLYNAY